MYEFFIIYVFLSNHSFLKLEENLKFKDAEISSPASLTISTVMFLILGDCSQREGLISLLKSSGCLNFLLLLSQNGFLIISFSLVWLRSLEINRTSLIMCLGMGLSTLK